MTKDQGHEIREYRYSLGAELLEELGTNGTLPLPSASILVRKMMEVFRSEGYEKKLRDMPVGWRPTERYWRAHLDIIRAYLRQHRNEYLEFVRNDARSFIGEWKFVTKQEYELVLRFEHACIGTQVNHHNEKIEDGKEKWPSLSFPMLKEVPLLESR
jgi:hypothetical protein